jgi:hypothetical protein
MCNLYAQTKGQAEICEVTRAVRNHAGNAFAVGASFRIRRS